MNLLKVSAVIMTGRFLKPRIKGLLVMIACWLIASFLHSEYLGYVELSGNTDFLLQSSLLKIGFYLLVFITYIFSVERKILLKTQAEIEIQQVLENTDTTDDGFSFLREKKTLDTASEQLLKK